MAYTDRFKPEALDITGQPEGLPFYEQDPTRIVVEGGDGDATGAVTGPAMQTTMLMPTATGASLSQLPGYDLQTSFPNIQLASLAATPSAGTTINMPGVNIPNVNIPTTATPTTPVTPTTPTTPAGTQVAASGGLDIVSILSSILGPAAKSLFGGGTTAAETLATTGAGPAATTAPAAATGAASAIQSALGQILPIGVPAAMAWMLYNASQGKGTAPFPYDPRKVASGYVPNEFEKAKMAQYPSGPPDVYPDGTPRRSTEQPGIWSQWDFYKQVEGLGTFSEQMEKFKEIYGIGGYTYGAGNDPIASSRESPEQQVVHAPAREEEHNEPIEVVSEKTSSIRNVKAVFEATPPKETGKSKSREQVDRETVENMVTNNPGLDRGLAAAAVSQNRKNENAIVFGTTPVKAKVAAVDPWAFEDLRGGRR